MVSEKFNVEKFVFWYVNDYIHQIVIKRYQLDHILVNIVVNGVIWY